MSVPLADQKGELVGLMQLVNARSSTGVVGSFDPEVVSFVEALSSDAAVAVVVAVAWPGFAADRVGLG